MLWQNNRLTFIIFPGKVSFHYLGQSRRSRCRRMLITCTLYFIVLLYTGSKFCLLSSNFTAEACSLLGWICVWYEKLPTKKQSFKKMTNNSLKERHPFELNFPFIYEHPNWKKRKMNIISIISMHKTKTNSSDRLVHCIRITGSLDACKNT